MSTALPLETPAQLMPMSIDALEEVLAYHGTDLETFSEDHEEAEEFATDEVLAWLDERGL